MIQVTAWFLNQSFMLWLPQWNKSKLALRWILGKELLPTQYQFMYQLKWLFRNLLQIYILMNISGQLRLECFTKIVTKLIKLSLKCYLKLSQTELCGTSHKTRYSTKNTMRFILIQTSWQRLLDITMKQSMKFGSINLKSCYLKATNTGICNQGHIEIRNARKNTGVPRKLSMSYVLAWSYEGRLIMVTS